MKSFLIQNWKTITLGIFGVIFVYLLVRVLTPVPDMSEVNKYKLEQIDKHINEMKNLQKSLSDSIQVYQNKFSFLVLLIIIIGYLISIFFQIQEDMLNF
jgi:hypothetical protein